MAWINIQNKSLEESLQMIRRQESKMWMDRAKKLQFSAGKNHSAITFKLVYELNLPTDWEFHSVSGFDFVVEGEGDHLSKFVINEVCEKFSQYLFFRKDDFGRNIPFICKFNLTLLKSLDTLRKDAEDPSTKWAKLTDIDFIPFKGKGGVRSAKLGFIFKTIKGQPISFEDYQEFITQRRFGKTTLYRQKMLKENEDSNKERELSKSISIFQIIDQIQKMIFLGKDFCFEELLQIKTESENQPEVIQYLLSPEEEGSYGDEFWKELTARPDFQKAFELISSLSDINRQEPKTEQRAFQIDEAVFTQYSIHHRAITAWSHSADQFNRDTKPNLMSKPFSFIALIAKIAKKVGFNFEECKQIFQENVRTRLEFFRELMNNKECDE